MGNNLKEYLDFNNCGFTLCSLQKILKNIIIDLIYIHDAGYYHGDLKPSNICFTSDRKNVYISKNRSKICDFIHNSKNLT